MLTALNIKARGDEVALPHYEEPEFTGNAALFPLHLVPFHVITLLNEQAAKTPALLEMVGFRNQMRWDSWVEINPVTASKLDIRNGDIVWVESARGKFKTKARIFAGAMPGVIVIPFGMGHTSGTYAESHGVNPNLIIAPQIDPLTGVTQDLSTKVKVYKA